MFLTLPGPDGEALSVNPHQIELIRGSPMQADVAIVRLASGREWPVDVSGLELPSGVAASDPCARLSHYVAIAAHRGSCHQERDLEQTREQIRRAARQPPIRLPTDLRAR